MAQNAQRGLRGTDPALIEILNRMENKDNTRKKFLMFPKQAFDGKSKQAAKNHWLEFQKYIAYQQQQELLDPDDDDQFPEEKQMFRLTLADNALGWYDAENDNWTTLEHIKQAFLKLFNIWGDTRHQQQDSWNKLQFNMAKDDVDSFVTDMRTLASILGHNEEVIAEKFKDVLPDKNIEAALIAMNNFGEMQTKAKQLVQIYHPNHTSDSSSLGAWFMHTHEGTATGSKPKPDKTKVSNQHQLAPTQNNDSHKQGQQHNQNRGGYKGNKPARGKLRAMMDITGKIIFGIVLEGQVEEEVEVEVEDPGLTILIMVGNPQTKTLNVGEEVIKIGDGVMDIIHNKINHQHMNIIIIHLRGNTLI